MSSKEELDYEFACPICTDTFKSPKGLPCLHSFCRECLRLHIINQERQFQKNGFTCPVCRHFVKPVDCTKSVPDWVDQFPTNHHIMNIMNVMLPEVDSRQCKLCAHREIVKRAIRTCTTCKEDYCDECSKFHSLLKATKNHTMVLISTENQNGGSSNNKRSNESSDNQRYVIKAEYETSIKVKNEADDKECWITGAIFLFDDRIVVCDKTNSKIKMFSATGDLVAEVDCMCPFDLTYMGNNEIAVCEGDHIKFCSVSNSAIKISKVYNHNWKVFVPKAVQLPSKVGRGIDFSRGQITISCSDDVDKHVIVKSRDGQMTRQIWQDHNGEKLFKDPWYCVLHPEHETAYVSDGLGVAGAIKCVSLQGRLKWEHKSPMPRGLCVFGDHLFVADWKDDQIKAISLDGSSVTTLLTRQEGIRRPQAIAVNHSGDKLLVSTSPPHNSEMVQIFSLKYERQSVNDTKSNNRASESGSCQIS